MTPGGVLFLPDQNHLDSPPHPNHMDFEYICLQCFGLHKVFVLLVFLETTHFDALLLLGCCYLASGNARETEDAGFCVISSPKF